MTNDFKAKRSGGNYNKPKLSPEDYKQFKADEKKGVYQLIDSAVTDIVNTPAEMQKYLDTQARMDVPKLLSSRTLTVGVMITSVSRKAQRAFLFLSLLTSPELTERRAFRITSKRCLTYLRPTASARHRLRLIVIRRILSRLCCVLHPSILKA